MYSLNMYNIHKFNVVLFLCDSVASRYGKSPGEYNEFKLNDTKEVEMVLKILKTIREQTTFGVVKSMKKMELCKRLS